MGVYAAGNSYGIPEDLIYSFPVQIKVSFGHSVDVLCGPFICRLSPHAITRRRTRPGRSWTGSQSTTSPARRWTPRRPSWWKSVTRPCLSDYPALLAKSPHSTPVARGSKDGRNNKKALHLYLTVHAPPECASVCVRACVCNEATSPGS